MIQGIKFASVCVSDQDRSLDFYTKLLGFKIATDQPFDDKQRWIELKIPGAETRIVLFTPPGQEDQIGKSSNITFYSDDVPTTHKTLSKLGVQFDGEPMVEDWGTAVILVDPDGNRFCLSSK